MNPRFQLFAALFIVLAFGACREETASGPVNLEKNGVHFQLNGALTEKDAASVLAWYGSLSAMIAKRDVDAILAAFSSDFTGGSGENLAEASAAMKKIYRSDMKFSYTLGTVKLTLTETGNILAAFGSTGSAEKKGVSRSFHNQEVMYWKKQGSNWRIIHWRTNDEF